MGKGDGGLCVYHHTFVWSSFPPCLIVAGLLLTKAINYISHAVFFFFFFFLYMMVSFTSILISNLFCLNRRGLIRVKFILAKVIMWNTCSVVSNKHPSSNLFALKGNQNFKDTLKPLMVIITYVYSTLNYK